MPVCIYTLCHLHDMILDRPVDSRRVDAIRRPKRPRCGELVGVDIYRNDTSPVLARKAERQTERDTER